MIVNYYKMTGEEFKKICAIIKIDLGLDQMEIAKRLGIGKTKLHENLNRGKQVIDKDVENALVVDPEFAAKRTLSSIQDKSSEQLPDSAPSQFYPGAELFAKSIEMLNDTLKLVSEMVMVVKDDNKHIKKTADLHQAIIEKAFNEGALRISGAKSK